MGWSFGGHLAPRAATGEHRIEACIADPGLPGLLRTIRDAFPLPDDVRDKLPNVDPTILEPIFDAILANPVLCWKF
jgi:hypothetical protein